MSNDESQSHARSGRSASPSALGAAAGTESTGTVAAADVGDGSSARSKPPQARVHDRHEPTAIDAELDAARADVFDAIAAWLIVAWEQPILRAMNSNCSRALDNADAFPGLRRALRDLQSNARQTVERNVAPLLDSDVPTRQQSLTSNVDTVVREMVGLIGAPLKDADFDPHSGGLERVHDGYRLMNMTDHEQITATLQTLTALKASRAAERAAMIVREHEIARVEVERLWRATAADV